jgi:hypothetical protein
MKYTFSRLLLLILVCFCSFTGNAQDEPKKFLHSINFEITGTGIIYSLNYNSGFIFNDNFRLSAGTGISYYPVGYYGHLLFSTHLTALAGKSPFYIEGGINYIFGYMQYGTNWYWNDADHFLFPSIGLRFQNPEKGVTVKSYILLINRHNSSGLLFHKHILETWPSRTFDSIRKFFPWPGLAVGYTF